MSELERTLHTGAIPESRPDREGFGTLLRPDLSRRLRMLELMDLPGCDEERLLRTVRQFRLINGLVSRYRTLLRDHVLADMAREPSRTHRLVDVGAGGCEIAVWLLRAARRRGLRLEVVAIDADHRIVQFARGQFGAEPGLEIREMDALALRQVGETDYAFSNHFLHHLDDDQIVEVLRQAGEITGRVAVFSDLARGYWPYYAFMAGAGLFLHRSFARYDGLLSIRKGFKPHDLRQYATRAGLRLRSEVVSLQPGRVALVVQCD
jgi:2-polyprenyl-3-methyl-5-hydroxy-6-metoxy-1,4-benzoquinol methylase